MNLAAQSYYQRNREAVKAKVRAYQAADPTGRKAAGQYLSHLRARYRRSPSFQTAVRLFIAANGLAMADVVRLNVTLADIIDQAAALAAPRYVPG